MTTDLSILRDFFEKSPRFIGFNDLFSELDTFTTPLNNFPPYDIYVYEDEITNDDITTHNKVITFDIALAGYSKDDFEVLINKGKHTVTIQTAPVDENSKKQTNKEYLHRGISQRSFRLSWKLNPEFELCEKSFKNGICHLEFKYSKKKEDNENIKITF